MRAAIVSSTGDAEDISITNIPILMFTGKGKILIDVYASAVNREDIISKKNVSLSGQRPQILGCEAAGVVSTAPKGSKWSVGDRVMAYLPSGGCAEKVIAHEDHVMSVPQWMTLSSAAALPKAWLTAYHLVCHEGCVKPGDNVLIHAGASGVGTALVQLVTMAGGNAIVTASTQGKIDICLSLGASAGFCYKTLDFAKDITNYFEGKDLNVIFDSVAGTHWQLNSKLIAENGTWIVYGLLSGPYIAGDMRPLLTKNVTIKTSHLKSKSHEYIAELISSFTTKVLPYFLPYGEFELSPVINKYYKFEQISQAHKFVESNQSVGKVIINIKDETLNQMTAKKAVKVLEKNEVTAASTSSQFQELEQASLKLLSVNQDMTNKGNSNLVLIDNRPQQQKINVTQGITLTGESQIVQFITSEELVETTITTS